MDNNKKDKKYILVNIRGVISPMTEEELKDFRQDHSWLSEFFVN